MESVVKLFNNQFFGKVRFICLDGKPYAVGKDVAIALGYKKPSNALKQHCRRRRKESILTNGGVQVMSVIPQGDIVRLVSRSHLEGAPKFESWIFDEVIPQILETGGYIPVQKEDTDEDILAKAFLISQKTIKNYEGIIKEKERTIEDQTKIIEKQNIDIEYINKVLDPPKLITTTDIAKDLGMSAIELHKLLHKKGLIFKKNREKAWKFYSPYQHLIPEYADYNITEYSQSLKWTEKGRRLIIDLLDCKISLENYKKVDRKVA